MTRKTITSIVALAAVALLAAGYFGTQAWIKANPKPSPYDFSNYPESPRLTNFDISKINRIENVSEGFVLSRENNNWELAYANTAAEKVKIDQSIISNKLWPMSGIWAESLIDEYPADLSIYGLENPQGHVIIGDSEGKTAELFFGNFTPSRTSYYVRMGGGAAVYTLSVYSTDIMLFSLDSIRNKDILSYINPLELSRFILEPRPEDNPEWEGRIDISLKDPGDYLVTIFASYVLNSPYSIKLGVDSDKFRDLLQSLMNIRIMEYVDDDPASLAFYGLDNPGRLYAESPEETIEILYGRGESGLRYAMLAGEKSVFTLGGFESLAAATPFSLIDRSAYIFFIDNVDSFTVSADGRTLEASIQGKGNEAIFYLNGRKAADNEFRLFYQAVIGLYIDAENPGHTARGEGTDFTIEYRLNTPPGGRAFLRLVPYNRDFYVMEKEGSSEFLIARTQTRKIFEAADRMVYIE